MKYSLILIIFSFILTGCPYQSDVELNTYEESLKVDKNLIDNWVAYHEDFSREELSVEKLAKSVIGITHKEFDDKGRMKGNNKFRAYATEIDAITVFNIETYNGKYMFLKYGWTGKNEFYVQAVNSNYVETNLKSDSLTTDELRTFFSKNVNQEKMYEEKLEFYRKDSPEHLKVKMFMKKSGF
jgi:hypothetical protein